MLAEVLKIFTQTYQPATEEDFTDCFSSAEIIKLIQEFSGDPVTTAELYKQLTQLHYRYLIFDGPEMRWILKKI